MPANPALIQQLLDVLDALSGLHPGFRPAHAKGLMCAGTFAPSPEAAKLTRARHASSPSTPVTVRYSDSQRRPFRYNKSLVVSPFQNRRERSEHGDHYEATSR